MTSSVPASSKEGGGGERAAADRLFASLRVFGVVVLALMLLSVLYSSWIALANWGSITV